MVLAAEAHRERQMREIVGHQRDVGGLQRDVRSGGAHGDADRRIRHGRRVVDAVADHRDLVLRRASFLIASTLSSGIRSPQASSSPTSLAIASATLWLSPEIMIMRVMPSVAQALQRDLGRLARRVHQADRAKIAGRPCGTTIVVRPPSRSVAIGIDRRGVQRADALRAEHLGLADPDRLAVDASP